MRKTAYVKTESPAEVYHHLHLTRAVLAGRGIHVRQQQLVQIAICNLRPGDVEQYLAAVPNAEPAA